MSVPKSESLMVFQFTRPRGARPPTTTPRTDPRGFQFTRPRGARRFPFFRCFPRTRVSIHAPARGATPKRKNRSGQCSSFNSRAREGRDALQVATPAKRDGFNSRAREGRDRRPPIRAKTIIPFQFTRPRGARRGKAASQEPSQCFNSRAREGRDSPPGSRATSSRRSFQFTRPRGARRYPFAGRSRPPMVSIHAPARGATPSSRRRRGSSRFNSRAREGRDAFAFAWSAMASRFQFTRPRGARRSRPWRAPPSPPCFNSRAREGRDSPRRPRRETGGRFNSRAREGRDPFRLRPRVHERVSIHAPARGATRGRQPVAPGDFVSIHAPARGATLFACLMHPSDSFNSRAREGRDAGAAGTRRGARVSIHAPARGATGETQREEIDADVSIHAPARGATVSSAALPDASEFQFTRPRGARPRTDGLRRGPTSFNSRAREGRDTGDPEASATSPFQFTRPRGARRWRRRRWSRCRRFNSRAREGRDSESAR